MARRSSRESGTRLTEKHPGRDKIDLIVEAAAKAIADAGVEKPMIDGVLVKMATSSPSILYGQKVAEALGLQPKVGGALDQGGAANIALISYAAMSIEAGLMGNGNRVLRRHATHWQSQCFPSPARQRRHLRLVLDRGRVRDDPSGVCARSTKLAKKISAPSQCNAAPMGRPTPTRI